MHQKQPPAKMALSVFAGSLGHAGLGRAPSTSTAIHVRKIDFTLGLPSASCLAFDADPTEPFPLLALRPPREALPQPHRLSSVSSPAGAGGPSPPPTRWV